MAIEVVIKNTETGRRKILAFQIALFEDIPMRPAALERINSALNEVSEYPYVLDWTSSHALNGG